MENDLAEMVPNSLQQSGVGMRKQKGRAGPGSSGRVNCTLFIS